MASLGKATFKSKTGNHYRFKVFPLGTRFRKISGIYMIAYPRTASTVGIDTRFSSWATPKTSRSRSRSTTKPKISCDSAPIASACNRTSRRSLGWKKNGTSLPPSVPQATPDARSGSASVGPHLGGFFYGAQWAWITTLAQRTALTASGVSRGRFSRPNKSTRPSPLRHPPH